MESGVVGPMVLGLAARHPGPRRVVAPGLLLGPGMASETLPDLITDPEEAAEAAGLRYVRDDRPGIRRERDGDDFRYLGRDGQPITNARTLARIQSLGIPPAWTDVWICADPRGHIQATGRDAKGRKQYRYHPRWREVRDETKYGRMMAFGQALPQIRARVDADLARPGLPREKALATVVRLLEKTFIRVGNEEYARQNDSYGLTTLRNEHVEVEGSKVRFHFRGKSGKEHDIDLADRRVARIIRKMQDLPGQEVFAYKDDDGEARSIDSDDVNAYLREITGQDFTAKDFRTWAGTVLAAMALEEAEIGETNAQAKKNVVRAIETVAARLGNTPAICRKCYVHPAIISSYLDGTLVESMKQRVAEALEEGSQSLNRQEASVLRLLQERLEEEAAPARKAS
jgi:DNA topoisomerase I